MSGRNASIESVTQREICGQIVNLPAVAKIVHNAKPRKTAEGSPVWKTCVAALKKGLVKALCTLATSDICGRSWNFWVRFAAVGFHVIAEAFRDMYIVVAAKINLLSIFE